jgi:hypothetical protein
MLVRCATGCCQPSGNQASKPQFCLVFVAFRVRFWVSQVDHLGLLHALLVLMESCQAMIGEADHSRGPGVDVFTVQVYHRTWMDTSLDHNTPMIQVSPEQVTSELKALFREDDPASLRCFAVLDGNADGLVWVDSLARPTWGIVQEAGFRSIYLGGLPDTQTLTRIIVELGQTGEVLIGLPNGDRRFEMLPPDCDYIGSTLEFTNRPVGEGLDVWLRQLPEGCQLQRVDRELFGRCLERDLLVSIFGSTEKALANGFGLCLMRGDQILSEAHAGPAALGMIEIGTMTHERHRYRGYATLTCAHLIHACEELGFQTYWNCAKQNQASVAIARKLGYRTMKEYELRACFQATCC